MPGPSMRERSCLVTGAGSGIGRAIARRLAEEGGSVLAVDRDTAAAERTRDEILTHGGSAAALGTDVSDRADRAEVVPAALEHFGRLDVLVNNAAYHGPRTRFVDLPGQEWDRVLETNLTGPADLCRAAAQHMLTAAEGTLLNISAIQEVLPLQTYVAYGASKGGLSALTRALATELSPHGIRVNAIAPGLIATESLQHTLESATGATAGVGGDAPALLGRRGLPEEVAAAAAFLASAEASYVTGVVLRVDGGRSISRLPDPLDSGLRTQPGEGQH